MPFSSDLDRLSGRNPKRTVLLHVVGLVAIILLVEVLYRWGWL